eukprot:COSAG04_NODE_19781_length_408_cov_0.841424_2_plen_70_part_01
MITTRALTDSQGLALVVEIVESSSQSKSVATVLVQRFWVDDAIETWMHTFARCDTTVPLLSLVLAHVLLL